MSLVRRIGFFGLLVMLLLSSLPTSRAWAQSCAFRHKLSFADGSVGCITNYPGLASKRTTGVSGTLQDLMPSHGVLAIAATGPVSDCPMSIGLGRALGSLTTPTLLESHNVAARNEQAVASCESAAGNKPECRCKVIISDGQSMLGRAEFDARFGVAGGASARAREQPAGSAAKPAQELHVAASASAKPSLPNATPAAPPARPASSPSVEDPARAQAQRAALERQDDFAKLQVEVDELRKRLRTPAQPEAVAATPTVAPKGKVRALVIGNSAYVSFGRLPNPRNDAQAIARKLQAMGIDVDLALDLDRDAFVRALNQYSLKAVGQDVNILYYAGHGVQVDGINYLVPTNMSADGVSAGYIKLNGISLNAALDYLPARTRLVFLDACRDNPVSRNLSATRGSGGAGLAPVGTASGTLIAYATKDGATADDGAGSNSPYTLGLLEHLGKPQDIAVILRQVRQTVMKLTSNRQEPWEYGSLVGDQLILSQIAR